MVDPDHLPGAERPKADGISKPVLAVDIIGISRKEEPVSQVNGSNPSIRGIEMCIRDSLYRGRSRQKKSAHL